MPITLTNRTYLDTYGNSLTFYRANAGDSQRANFTLKESISVQSSVTVQLTLNIPMYEVTWLGGSFEDEGFRTGDVISVLIYSSAGTLINSYSANVTFVSGNTFGISTLLGWYDASAGESVIIGVTSRRREGVKLAINHVQNGAVGNSLSLIDAEATQMTFDLTGSSPFAGVKVAKQSGQFDYTAQLTLLSTSGIYNTYSLSIDVVQSGIYDSTWFSSNNCLKLYVELSWQSLLGEPYSNTRTIISEDANTGWFDEPYNLDVLDATLIQGINQIYFDIPTAVQVVVDCASVDYAFGFSYVPQDDAYYKNQFDNQSTLSGLLPSTVMTIGGTETGATLPNGGYMDITLVNAVQVGTVWTFDLLFTPSTGFDNFMLSKAGVDRLFYVWVKIGNLNLLAFDNLLSENVPVGGPITMLVEDFTDHSQNVTTGTGTEITYEANVEDDLGFYGAFRIPENENCESFTAILQAFNPVTNESFDLQTAFFSFASIPMVGGKYVLNESVPLFTSFDSNSAKISALFKLNSTYDTTGEYGVDIFFPFLYRWEYWLAQLNADADFYPNNQTKNYVPYGNTTPWTLRVRLELIKEGLMFFNDNTVVIKDYDSDSTIDQTIDLFVESTNQNVNVIVEGELMRIECTHTLNDGTFWVPFAQWGMITAEPYENAPRWWCSTAVPFDGNGLNPLTPLTGSLCDVSYPNFNQVKLTCYFNPSKINLQNGVKFTSKIKGCTTSTRPKFKYTTDGKIKQTTSGGLKEMS
jgi:hypothetical protein